MKTHSVSSDLRRAIGSGGFVIGLAGMMLMIAIASINTILTQLGPAAKGLVNGFHAQLILDALKSDDVTLALPILCALPFTASFVDDIKSGFIRQYLPRSGIGGYIKGKLIACAVSGGMVLTCGVFVAYGLSALVFMPMELAQDAAAVAQPYFSLIFTKALILFFSGAFWSLTGFAFASMTMSRHMAYASPFILYYVLIILHERYFRDFFVLYPKEWLLQSQIWIWDQYGILLLIAILCAVMCLLFGITARRRLKNA